MIWKCCNYVINYYLSLWYNNLKLTQCTYLRVYDCKIEFDKNMHIYIYIHGFFFSYENTVNSILDNHASWNRSAQKWNLQKENIYLSWNITQYSTLHEWISMKNSVGFNGDVIVTLRANHVVNKDQKYQNHAGRICMLQL